MGRTIAMVWHASFALVGGVLYFFFVLPRWPELTGHTTHTLGTALRIVTGVVIALAALPVVFTWLRTRKPEYGTPQLALRLRIWSIVAHPLAGVLIVGTAISEIWLTLDTAGQWLFGIYGAAAAIAVLAIFAFYLSFVAELPPPPPKPIKPKKEKKEKQRRRRKKAAEEQDQAEQTAPEEAAEQSPDEARATEVAPTAVEEQQTAGVEAEPTEESELSAEDTVAAEAPRAGLRNRRPSGKSSGRRGRSRRGVSVDD
jgi:MFS family permease